MVAKVLKMSLLFISEEIYDKCVKKIGDEDTKLGVAALRVEGWQYTLLLYWYKAMVFSSI